MISPKWNIFAKHHAKHHAKHTHTHIWLRDHCIRGDRKILRARGSGWLQGEQCLLNTAGQLHIWTQQLWDRMHKAYASQSRPNPSTKSQGGHEVLPLAAKLLAIVSCYGGRGSFFENAAPGKLTTLQWKNTHSRIFLQYKLILTGLKNNQRTQN